MSYQIEVSKETYERVAFAAKMADSSPGRVVEKLVADAYASAPSPAISNETGTGLPVHAVYEGHRVEGRFDTATSQITITSGNLTGQTFKTPSAAARAVVGDLNPRVSGARNGWSFWMLDDGSGSLQTVRNK
ncbi:DUF4357 domain-containing protein [Nocardia sp. BMG111209]|uniref:DUF4357 domain-containing protein n=1 Tax=Nocardia sp. BMG111209 TaxID=1160137 RepID=UPI000373D489|nr:DUF4357 domain-containing protein [Nocardia sp. BMG111209]